VQETQDVKYVRYDKTKKKEYELEADTLAGAVMACIHKGAPITPEQEVSLKRFFSQMGFDPVDHGTPQERLDAFKQGYTGGVPAGLFTP